MEPQDLIKNPTILRFGYRYERRDATDECGEPTQYHYAEPVDYADGCSLGDCWIVNQRGRRHPGYNVSPVPMHASSLRNGRPCR